MPWECTLALVTLGDSAQKETVQLRINQLPVFYCQFLPTGGRMGLKYDLPHLFNEKITRFIIVQQPLKLEKK